MREVPVSHWLPHGDPDYIFPDIDWLTGLANLVKGDTDRWDRPDDQSSFAIVMCVVETGAGG